MDRENILYMLRQNADTNGRSQFDFSHDNSAKLSEQKILEQLESEGIIQKLTVTLGYGIYRIL